MTFCNVTHGCQQIKVPRNKMIQSTADRVIENGIAELPITKTHTKIGSSNQVNKIRKKNSGFLISLFKGLCMVCNDRDYLSKFGIDFSTFDFE